MKPFYALQLSTDIYDMFILLLGFVLGVYAPQYFPITYLGFIITIIALRALQNKFENWNKQLSYQCRHCYREMIQPSMHVCTGDLIGE